MKTLNINKSLLTKNHLGYYTFEFKNVTFYILEGMLKFEGTAFGFGSELDSNIYFTSKEMPNARLKNALKFAQENNFLY